MFYFIFIHIILSIVIVLLSLLSVSFFTLWERKLLSGIQRRHGPVFVGVFGILQPFADGLKLLFKATSIPQGGYYYIYFLASFFSLVLSLLSWSVIPMNQNFIYADINLSLIFILAVSSLNVYTTLFSGWSSNSKYGLLGSVRAGAQMISYELPMSLALMSVIVCNSSANLLNIIFFQIDYQWNIIILIPSFFIFLVTSLAETNRAPFDLPEAESELVAGYNMEYSSMVFALFFLAEYNHIILMSTISVIIFFGGWSLNPFNLLINDFFIYKVCWSIIAAFISTISKNLFSNFVFYSYYYELLLSACYKMSIFSLFVSSFVLFFKSVIMSSFFVIIRACVPRYKFTQLIKMCWETFIPASFCFLMIYLWLL